MHPPNKDKLRKKNFYSLTKVMNKIVAEEKIFEERLGVKCSLLDKEREKLQKRKEELEEANKEDKKSSTIEMLTLTREQMLKKEWQCVKMRLGR